MLNFVTLPLLDDRFFMEKVVQRSREHPDLRQDKKDKEMLAIVNQNRNRAYARLSQHARALPACRPRSQCSHSSGSETSSKQRSRWRPIFFRGIGSGLREKNEEQARREESGER